MPDESGPPGVPPPDDGPPEDLLAIFRQLLGATLEQVQRHQDEIRDAILSEVRDRTSPDVLARAVLPTLQQVFARDVGPLVAKVNQLSDDVATLSQRPPVTAAPTNGATHGTEVPAVPPAPAGRGPFTAQSIAALADTIFDMFTVKFLPALTQWKMMQRDTIADVRWAQELRARDPVRAAQIAQQLGYEALTTLLPQILAANAQQVAALTYGTGVKTGAQIKMAAAAIARGENPWPGLPQPGLPGSSTSPSPAPYVPPTAPLPMLKGVSMEQICARKR